MEEKKLYIVTCVGVTSSPSSLLPVCGRYDLLVIAYSSSLIEPPFTCEIPSSERASDCIPLSLESGELMSKPALANLYKRFYIQFISRGKRVLNDIKIRSSWNSFDIPINMLSTASHFWTYSINLKIANSEIVHFKI